jgi:hypothetical protein
MPLHFRSQLELGLAVIDVTPSDTNSIHRGPQLM